MVSVFVDGNTNVRGCACGPECEFPCWQRVGLTTDPCCETCPTLVDFTLLDDARSEFEYDPVTDSIWGIEVGSKE